MKTDGIEITHVQGASTHADIVELGELQLALVGGGCGEIVVA